MLLRPVRSDNILIISFYILLVLITHSLFDQAFTSVSFKLLLFAKLFDKKMSYKDRNIMNLNDIETKEILEEFENLIYSNMGSYLLLENPTIKSVNLSEIEERVLSNWMTFIFLNNPNFSLYFKLYYNNSDLKKIIEEVFKDNKKTNDISFMNDYMKELSNTLGGRINEVLRDIGIDLIMSSPFIASGFDDLFLDKDKKEFGFKNVWKIKDKNYSFFFSIELKSSEPEDINKLKLMKGYERKDEIDLF